MDSRVWRWGDAPIAIATGGIEIATAHADNPLRVRLFRPEFACLLRKENAAAFADAPGGISRTGHCVPSPRARIPPLLLALSNGATAGPIEIATGGSGIVDHSVPSP